MTNDSALHVFDTPIEEVRVTVAGDTYSVHDVDGRWIMEDGRVLALKDTSGAYHVFRDWQAIQQEPGHYIFE